MPARDSIPSSYFENMFAADPDPWRFETSDYEKAKYAHTVAALEGRRYGRAFEIGCANGVLTRMLSGVTDTLLSIDVSESALTLARARNAGNSAIRFARMRFPEEAPSEGAST